VHRPRIVQPTRSERPWGKGENHSLRPGSWLALVAVVLLLSGLTATVAWAGPAEFPNWLEPRALNIVDLVGEVPETILKDTIISYGDNTGIIVYQAGQRISNAVIVTTTIYPRWEMATQATLLGCLGQFPYYDHMGSLVPTSTLRIYDTSGADVTYSIKNMSLTQMGTQKPLANTSAYYRYAEVKYGPNQPRPLPLTPDGLLIPPNAGCRIWIPGHNLYPLTGIFRLEFPPTVEVAVRGQQTAVFNSYIGVGNVGVFQPLMNQMRTTYPDRHARIYLGIPPVVDYVLVKFPPMPGDAYMTGNARRPTGGTYRLALDVNRLGTDLIFSAGFPTAIAWRDRDQAPNARFLPEMVEPRWLAPPEYVIPAGVPYDDCFTRGDCPPRVLEEIYETEMEMEITYLKVIRRVNNGAWVPVRFTGPAWSPALLSAGATPARAAVQTAGPSAPPPLTGATTVWIEGPGAAPAAAPSPAMSLTKSGTPDENVGYLSPVIYTLALRNGGALAAQNITLTDDLPDWTAFDRWLAQPPGATVNGSEVIWRGAMEAGQAVTLTFVANQTAASGATITNTARFSHAGGLGTASAAFTVEASPTLSILKSVAPEQNVSYRQSVTYELLVINRGHTDAWQVQITDTLAPQTTFARWIEQPPGATVSTGTLTWTGTISVGRAVTLTYAADQAAGLGATVINSAVYKYATGHGRASAAFHLQPPPILGITKTVSPQQNVGYHAPVTYSIIVRNPGPADATEVLVSDTLPSATIFRSWIVQPSGALATSRRISWTGAISAQQAATFTFVVNQSGRPGSIVENRTEVHYLDSVSTATASFGVEAKDQWPIYLPLVVRGIRDDPWEPLPEGCPCGWFDELGRMLDFAAGY